MRQLWTRFQAIALVAFVAAFLAWPQVGTAQEITSSIVGVWKLKSFSTKDVATEKVSKPFGERPSGYFFFTRGGRVAFVAVAQDRKSPLSTPTDAERADLYKTMIAAFTGTYKVDGPEKIVMQLDTSWNQAWTGTDQSRSIQIAGSELTVRTPPLKNMVSGQEFVVTAIFDRAE